MKIEELNNSIEKLRCTLNELISDKGKVDDEVYKISTELDKLINQYYNICKINKN